MSMTCVKMRSALLMLSLILAVVWVRASAPAYWHPLRISERNAVASQTMEMAGLISWHCPARCRAWRVWADQKWWRPWCHACAEWGK